MFDSSLNSWQTNEAQYKIYQNTDIKQVIYSTQTLHFAHIPKRYALS